MNQSTNKKKRFTSGCYVAIPLPSGGFGFGRILEKQIAFYDFKSETSNFNEKNICKAGIAFIAGVSKRQISNSKWNIVGRKPLEKFFKQEIKQFRRDPSGKGLLIYVIISEPRNAYREYKASPEECLGLEPLASWDVSAIEQRLDDYFSGNENDFIKREVAYVWSLIHLH